MDFSDEEFYDDRDVDYIPNSSASDSDSDVPGPFIPVGFMTQPQGASSTNVDVPEETERGTSPVIPVNTQNESQIAGLSLSAERNAKNKHFCVFCGQSQTKLK